MLSSKNNKIQTVQCYDLAVIDGSKNAVYLIVCRIVE